MKLTGLLKNNVDVVETKEEKKAIIAEAGMELTDDELDNATGGANGEITYYAICPKCTYKGTTSEFITLNHYGFTCPKCGYRWR